MWYVSTCYLPRPPVSFSYPSLSPNCPPSYPCSTPNRILPSAPAHSPSLLPFLSLHPLLSPSLRHLLFQLLNLSLLTLHILVPLYPSLLKVKYDDIPPPNVETTHPTNRVEGVVDVIVYYKCCSLGSLGVPETNLTDGSIFTEYFVQFSGCYL